jgi:hypothetical protein
MENNGKVRSTEKAYPSDPETLRKSEIPRELTWKETSFMSSCGVKQGGNLGPIIFLYIVQAVVMTLDDKWQFTKPDFDGTATTQMANQRRCCVHHHEQRRTSGSVSTNLPTLQEIRAHRSLRKQEKKREIQDRNHG